MTGRIKRASAEKTVAQISGPSIENLQGAADMTGRIKRASAEKTVAQISGPSIENLQGAADMTGRKRHPMTGP